MKLIKIFLIMLLSSIFKTPILCSANSDLQNKTKPNIKILVLIIASEDKEVYPELEKLWRSYMHYDRDHIEAYFLRANPDLEVECKIVDDIVWVKTYENQIPGIINKTITAMELFLPRMREFNYILRTNLSSFYNFDRLLKFLENRPTDHFYSGSDIGTSAVIGSGCGFLISPDVVQMLIHGKYCLLNNRSHSDDFLMGCFFNNNGVYLTHHDRMDLMPINVWNSMKDKIPENMFHFRVKNAEDLRLKDDIYIHSELIKMFYSLSLDTNAAHSLGMPIKTKNRHLE